MNPLITIIIPAYNAESYIERCLTSLVNQSYKNLEILVINDGSTDNSEKIIRKVKKKDSRIVLINQENRGVSSARNKGLNVANGKFVTFVDADDFVEFDYIEVLYNSIKTNNADISICNLAINNRINFEKNNLEIKLFDSESAIINMLLGNYFDSSVCCKLIKCEIAKAENFREDLLIAEDLYYYYCLFKKCNRISYVNKICYHYMQNENGAISTISDKKVENLNLFEEMISKCDNEPIKNAICSKYVSTCFHFLSLDTSNLSDNNVNFMKNIIEKYRLILPFKKNVKFKVRGACILSFIGFNIVNLFMKIRKDK